MTTGQDAATNRTAPAVQVLAQFIKDMSFENPGVKQPAAPQGARPQIQVGIDVQAAPLGNDQYEVSLRVMTSAKNGETTSFVVELVYAGVFLLQGIPQETLQPFLLIECPRLLFPFARRVVADITRDGGYPPLMLDPIDFAALYRQQMQQQRAATPSATA